MSLSCITAEFESELKLNFICKLFSAESVSHPHMFPISAVQMILYLSALNHFNIRNKGTLLYCHDWSICICKGGKSCRLFILGQGLSLILIALSIHSPNKVSPRFFICSQKQLAHWAVDVTAQVVPC